MEYSMNARFSRRNDPSNPSANPEWPVFSERRHRQAAYLRHRHAFSRTKSRSGGGLRDHGERYRAGEFVVDSAANHCGELPAPLASWTALSQIPLLR